MDLVHMADDDRPV